MENPRPPDVRVRVQRFDVLGTALVRNFRDRPDQRQVVRMSRNAQQLAGLEVDSDLDGEAGVACESLLGSHSCAAYTGFRADSRSFSRTPLREPW